MQFILKAAHTHSILISHNDANQLSPGTIPPATCQTKLVDKRNRIKKKHSRLEQSGKWSSEFGWSCHTLVVLADHCHKKVIVCHRSSEMIICNKILKWWSYTSAQSKQCKVDTRQLAAGWNLIIIWRSGQPKSGSLSNLAAGSTPTAGAVLILSSV